MQLFETLLNGFLIGGLYGLIGLGLSINFGTMRVVHLAHGDLIVLAAYFLVLVPVPTAIPPLAPPAPLAAGGPPARSAVGRRPRRGGRPPRSGACGLSMGLQNALLL